ncbi:class I SAM-dependent methyltransferase [Hyphomicrobium sp. CS1BSMeth3]|uniref:methyltransferase domain-containing protein n=1 Tax=Hyphomicrobium sp. CS1BSMeth3 TaxID=1892844 RepID=UPI001160DC78
MLDRVHRKLPPREFDVVVSENTLEHVMDVPGLLAEVRRRLKPGGKVYIGFGPLYHAPDGDHGWLREMLPGWPRIIWPWGHLMLRSYALKKLSRMHGREYHAPRDWMHLDLNQHTIDDYRRMFEESGLTIVDLRTNYVTSFKGKLIARAARIPGLEKYCTLNLNVILAKLLTDSDGRTALRGQVHRTR